MEVNEQRIKELKEKLSKKDTKVLLQTLKEVKTEGNYSLIPYLVSILKDTNKPEVVNRIEDIFNNLNIQASVPYLVESIRETQNRDLLNLLISSCWKNGLDYSDYLDAFVDKFLKHDFDIALEAFTVIENATTNSEIGEYDRMIQVLKDHLSNVDTGKKALMEELIQIFENRKQNSI
jgi:hypothetical protein